MSHSVPSYVWRSNAITSVTATGLSGFTLIGSSSESYDSLSEGANAFRMKYSRMLNAFGSPK